MSDETQYPIFISPTGEEYTCIFWVNHMGFGWEWYGFELVESTEADDIYFGYVMGSINEFKNFSLNDLKNIGVVKETKKADELNSLLPPIGWTKKTPHNFENNSDSIIQFLNNLTIK